ncbi:MAG: hypothetical protein E7300_04780 [Lachnospiraceae bacterium]|nr:hypothetical protein [Lachnospiraceae bacterium]
MRKNDKVMHLISALLIIGMVSGLALTGCGQQEAPAPAAAEQAETDEVKKEEAQASPEEKAEVQTESKDVSALLEEADQLVSDNASKVKQDDAREDAMANISRAIDLYKEAASGDAGAAGSGIVNAFNVYKDGALDRVLMLLNLETGIDIYEETQLQLDTVIELGEGLASEGYRVDLTDLQDKKKSVAEDYKSRIISQIDTMLAESHQDIVQNEEYVGKALKLFEVNDPTDPLQMRYAYTKAMLVHQEVQDDMKAGKGDAKDWFNKIVEALPEACYAEFLMEEAEQLAWQFNAHEAYFEKVSLPVIEDSDEREYKRKDIDELKLSAAEMRYARMEIYARHNVKLLDKDAAKALGVTKGTDIYSFKPYDEKNGLKGLERRTVRAIAELELDNITSGYFAIGD